MCSSHIGNVCLFVFNLKRVSREPAVHTGLSAIQSNNYHTVVVVGSGVHPDGVSRRLCDKVTNGGRSQPNHLEVGFILVLARIAARPCSRTSHGER